MTLIIGMMYQTGSTDSIYAMEEVLNQVCVKSNGFGGNIKVLTVTIK